MTTIRIRTLAGVAQRVFLCGLFFVATACSEERPETPYTAGRTQYSTDTTTPTTREVDNPYGPMQLWAQGPSLTSLFASKTVDAGSGGAAAYKVMAAAAPAIQRTSRSLAYAHIVSVELDKEHLSARVTEIQNACASSKEFGCEVLDVASEGQRGVPSGSIRMRLAPAGVEPIIAIAAKGGEVTGRTTHAEDLAEPVADTERQLALLTTHRDRLAEFMKSKDLKVDQLITVSKELAAVQSQIDALSTERANLQRRIATELLVVNLAVPADVASREQHPVRDAVRRFGSLLLEAFGDVIQFFAVLLPWLLVIVPGLFLLRLFWRWMSRWIARREARTQAG